MSLNKAATVSASRDLPPGLVVAVQNQRVVMFLGAGASLEARGPNNAKPPSAGDLRTALARHFFDDPLDNYDLMSVASMAIQQAGQGAVFERVRALLEPFNPSPAHQLLPRFHWRQIATTNYDLLIERAYASCANPVQEIVPLVKNSEPVLERRQAAKNPVELLKLHGCLAHLHDEAVPLVLSHEHYSLYERNRNRLFDRLRDHAHESTFVFCGYGLGDSHIRDIIHRLEAGGIKRPAWYVVTPKMMHIEAAYWATQNIHVIPATFGVFMSALDAAIPEMFRAVPPGVGISQLPIQTHFRTLADPSQRLRASLETDLRHIHPAMPVETQDPRKFYSGYDTGWGAIALDLDVHRRVVEDLLLEAVSDEGAAQNVRFHLLRGPAGAGKTVALKRAAWNAAAELGQVVLWLEDQGALRPEVLSELWDLTGKRLVVFIDRAAERLRPLEALLALANRRGMQVSVIAAERDNEWNVYGASVDGPTTPRELRIGQLSSREVGSLVDLLARHGSLGLLQSAPREQQVETFLGLADRQLLVALHEATRGKPFEEIIFDEYSNIVPDRARRLYLDICTLNQFGEPARAGTISRATGIRFEEFKTELLGPLEGVVMTVEEPYSGDMGYKARHSKVAAMVFQQACLEPQSRSEQLIRLIDHLDIGYSADRRIVEQIAKGRLLADVLPVAALGREVYLAVLRAAPSESFVYQQWAIYEMQVPDGSFEDAEKWASKAAEEQPGNKSFAHTRVEVSRRRAQAAPRGIKRDQLRRQAKQRLASAGTSEGPVLATRCKILVDEVADLAHGIRDNADEAEERELAEKVRDAELAIRGAHQHHPDDPDLLQTEARLSNILGNESRAITALERAWMARPRGSAVALRLSKAYAAKGDPRAAAILEEALERAQDDKAVHFELAKRLLASADGSVPKAGQHLERSYVRGDRNFDARHLHAQFLFMVGRASEAVALFAEVDGSAPPNFWNGFTPHDTLVSRRLGRYVGNLARKEATYAFIATTVYPKHVYAPERNSDPQQWALLSTGSQAEFGISFSRRGPVASDVRPR